MAENLNVTKYRDGTSIPNVTETSAWMNLSTSAYCNYNNVDDVTTYERLYNFYSVVDNRNLCPAGWHVPTDNE